MEGKVVKFFSTIRGIEEQNSQQDTVYYGFPLSFDGDMTDEEEYGRHMAELGDEIIKLVATLEEKGLVVGAVFEVYQVFDAQAADRSHTMVRIPTLWRGD